MPHLFTSLSSSSCKMAPGFVLLGSARPSFRRPCLSDLGTHDLKGPHKKHPQKARAFSARTPCERIKLVLRYAQGSFTSANMCRATKSFVSALGISVSLILNPAASSAIGVPEVAPAEILKKILPLVVPNYEVEG